MRITESQLRKIIREEIEIINRDSGEILTVDAIPPKYRDRVRMDGNYTTLPNSDFESLRRNLELDPDDALAVLEDLAAEMRSEAQGDLGTAIDLAMSLKLSDQKTWAAALKSERIKNMYHDQDGYGDQFQTINDALAYFLAEQME